MSGSSNNSNSCNFYSELKTLNPITFTWKIDQLKTFLQLYERSYEHADQISCRFQGNLIHGLRDTWILRFENSTYPYQPYLVLQRTSQRSDRVFVCAEVLLLNSENVNVYSKKSELTPMGPNESRLVFNLGLNWCNFIVSLTDGVLTVKCTVEQKVWVNVKTCNPVSHQITDEDQIQREALAEDFKNLLESTNNSDVSFKLMNGYVLAAHKAILSARSPVFQRMFMTEMKEAKDNSVVEINDIGEEAMKVLLLYIYTGKLEVQDKCAETFKDLVYAADKYQLNKLKELCDDHLPEYCDAKNAFDLLNVARSHDLKTAEDLICTFIEMNIASIIKPFSAQQ